MAIMKKTIIVHPFLFALFPVLFLYSHNIAQLSFSETLLPAAIISGAAIIGMLLLWIILKKDWKKAGIINTVFIILFFSYGRVYGVIKAWQIGDFAVGRHRYLMIVWALIFIAGIYLTIRIRKDLNGLTNILNIIAIVLILFSLISIVTYKIKINSGEKDNIISVQEEDHVIEDLEGYPDIYYIILDGYASSNSLKQFYDYDNSGFTDYLGGKGFYVTEESISNYSSSFLSLASSLNMEYINYLSDSIGEESEDRTAVYQMIENNKVMSFLKSRGYRFIHLSSGWGPTNHNQYADLNIEVSQLKWNEFNTLLIQTTVLGAFEKKFFEDTGRSRVINTFKNLSQIYEIEGRKFIFSHIVCPHPPYLFDKDGGPVPEVAFDMDDWGQEQKQYYLNQLIYINKEVEKLVGEILAKSEVPPIIILQADHGPHNTFIVGKYPTDDMFKEGMRIFNAYYLPFEGDGPLYDSISPVNTFRIVFNLYFDTDFELLEDRNYYSFAFEPYRFIELTDMVGY